MDVSVARDVHDQPFADALRRTFGVRDPPPRGDGEGAVVVVVDDDDDDAAEASEWRFTVNVRCTHEAWRSLETQWPDDVAMWRARGHVAGERDEFVLEEVDARAPPGGWEKMWRELATDPALRNKSARTARPPPFATHGAPIILLMAFFRLSLAVHDKLKDSLFPNAAVWSEDARPSGRRWHQVDREDAECDGARRLDSARLAQALEDGVVSFGEGALADEYGVRELLQYDDYVVTPSSREYFKPVPNTVRDRLRRLLLQLAPSSEGDEQARPARRRAKLTAKDGEHIRRMLGVDEDAPIFLETLTLLQCHKLEHFLRRCNTWNRAWQDRRYARDMERVRSRPAREVRRTLAKAKRKWERKVAALEAAKIPLTGELKELWEHIQSMPTPFA